MKILLNLLRHELTSSQLEDLAFCEIHHLRDLRPETFESLASITKETSLQELVSKAHEILGLGYTKILCPLGSPLFQMVLMQEATRLGKFEFLFSFSERVSKEVTRADGSVSKMTSFNHIRFDSISTREEAYKCL